MREHCREHRRALTLGAFALAAAAAAAVVTVSIATGHTARRTAVFARASSLTASRGAVGPGLSIDGSTLAQMRAGTKRTLGTVGGGDEVIAPLTGSLTPVGVTTPDGASVVYSSWRQLARIKPDARGQGLSTGDPVGVPSVRLFDVRSGKDSLLAMGAASPAVSGTGAVAYLAGDSTVVRQNVEYTGRIVVADSPSAKPRVWTSRPGRYLPYAWAGTHAARLPRRPGFRRRRSLRLHRPGRIESARAERIRHRGLARRRGGGRFRRYEDARADPRFRRRRAGQPRAGRVGLAGSARAHVLGKLARRSDRRELRRGTRRPQHPRRPSRRVALRNAAVPARRRRADVRRRHTRPGMGRLARAVTRAWATWASLRTTTHSSTAISRPANARPAPQTRRASGRAGSPTRAAEEVTR